MSTPIIRSDELAVLVCKALGVDPGQVSRIVLDMNVGYPVVAYVEMCGDTRLLEIDWSRLEAEIRFSDEQANPSTNSG